MRPALRLTRRAPRAPLRTLLRVASYAAIGASVAVPLLRHRRSIPPALTVAATVAGPVALAILKPRSKTRDAILFAQQMWAFTMVHELPYDDPAALRRRLKVRYPIRADRLLGAGRLPNARLQDALMAPSERVGALDRLLTFAHWIWFLEPHLSLLFILVRDEPRFARAARQMAAAYDLGCAVYFAVPTAPPWWAAAHGFTGEDRIHRRMLDVGEDVWGRAWPPLFNSVDGNPWAAMPSLHFGASVLAAILLGESNRAAGAVGWSYAGLLGFALVYLGEHYVVDLIAGLALVAVVRRGEPLVEPLALALSRGVQRLERVASA